MLFIPLACMVAILVFRTPPKATALFGSVLNLMVSFWVLMLYSNAGGGSGLELNIRWIEWPGFVNINFHLGVDGVSLPMVLLTTIVTVAAVAVSPVNIKRVIEFYLYLQIISLGALGAFLSKDLFFLYVFHEFALIPTFLMIGIWGGLNRQYSSMQLTLYLALGSLILLAGILGLVLALPPGARTFDLVEIQRLLVQSPIPELLQKQIYPFLLIGFGILISLFPFHTWAPAGYAAAPAGVAMLHAGVLKKFGLYALLRVVLPLLPAGARGWENVLIILLLGNVLYVGYVTMAQKELPLMLGYSSVMHMGYLFLGLTAWNVIGWTGVVILMVGHGLSAAALFGLNGEILRRTGESRMDRLGGLGKKMPFISTCFLMASMASIGLPGFANFAGEVTIFFGAWRSHPYATVGALWGVVISAVYQLRAMRAIFFGVPANAEMQVTDITSFWGRAPYYLLLGASLIIGFYPQWLIRIIEPSIQLVRGGI